MCRYMALVLMIIGAMATATTIGWTLATLVKVDFPVSRYGSCVLT